MASATDEPARFVHPIHHDVGERRTRLVALIAIVSVSGWVHGCTEAPIDARVPSSSLPPAEHATLHDPFEPIPASLELDPERVELGRRLFLEPLLSGDGERACVDCHDLHAGGVVPGEPRSNHPLNATGPYNVPTVFNVAFNFRYNWQGKFVTLEEHLNGPMMNADVMNAGSWPEVVERLAPYERDFLDFGYADGLTEENVRDAIAEYQRSLITPDARFDRFLRGEIVLSDDEEDGYALFKDIGCATCHQGINVGGNLFQRFGVMEDAFAGREPVERDYGRMLVTGREEDEFVFRVPSLRNVAITAPYFHDGSAATLEDAVEHMGRVQLGYVLDPAEVAAIVAFLHTLTGTYAGEPLDEPERESP